MITVLKVINAVNKLLFGHYPECDFHIQNIPEGFKRPAFFIDLVTDSSKDNNTILTDEKISLQVVYFAPVDGHQIRQKENQLEAYSNMKALFKKGYIQVEDRALRITNLEGGPRDNEVYLTIDVAFADDRPQDSESYDTVGEVKLK